MSTPTSSINTASMTISPSNQSSSGWGIYIAGFIVLLCLAGIGYGMYGTVGTKKVEPTSTGTTVSTGTKLATGTNQSTTSSNSTGEVTSNVVTNNSTGPNFVNYTGPLF